jgi:Relaxase/Mobilisation nuclease domain
MSSPGRRSCPGRAALAKRLVRLPTDGPRFFEVVSYGRAGPQMPARFSPAQIEQIARTVRHTPEVMVKVTGGGTRRGAVAAHFAYLSRAGTLEIETDEGERIGRREEQKRLLDDWHLELTAGQYRRQKDGARRPTKLVHNIVLSMPRPTPADKILTAARQFARKRFAQHRYAMVLHTHQQHPHVHLVVKAENELGRRLHIDKQLLRDWREDFARMMREQGIAANATPRAIRGKNKRNRREGIFKAQFYGKSKSAVMRECVLSIATEMSRSGTIEDPARDRLIEARRSLVSTWMKAADVLDGQGEEILAGDVRYFAWHLPPVLTDRQRLAAQFIRINEEQRRDKPDGPKRSHPKVLERTR